MTENPGIVVIGGGLTAAKAVETLREEGFDGAITLIGDESERPYERPPLSKDYLQGKSTSDDLFVHDEGWYGEHAVETRFGDAAVSIDRELRTVTLSSGRCHLSKIELLLPLESSFSQQSLSKTKTQLS